jgi:hypothetical protein
VEDRSVFKFLDKLADVWVNIVVAVFWIVLALFAAAFVLLMAIAALDPILHVFPNGAVHPLVSVLFGSCLLFLLAVGYIVLRAKRADFRRALENLHRRLG